MHRTARSIFSAAISLTLLGIARAGTDGAWVGGGGDSNWSNAANWNGSIIADGADASALFSLDLSGDQAVTLDSARTIGNLSFADTDPVNTTGNWVVNGTVPLTLQTSSGTPTITTTPFGPGNYAQLDTPIAGNQGIILAGPGPVYFSAANTFTGGLTISSGSTLIANGSYITTSGNNLTVNGSFLLRQTSAATAVVDSLSGSGTIGTDALATGSIGLRVKQGSFSGNLTDGPGAANGAHLSLAFDSSASGLLELSGVNTYTGDILVRGNGTLRLSSTTALPDSSYLRLETAANTSASIELNAGGDFIRKIGGAAYTGGTNIGAGTNTRVAFGTLGQDRSVIFTDGTNSTPVTLKWATGGFNPTAFALGTPASDHKTTLVNPIDINGAGRTLSAGNGSADIDAEYSGVISNSATAGSLTLTGPGTMLLSADNSGFTNSVVISTAIVRLTSANSLGSPTTGTVTISGNAAGTGRLELTDALNISKPFILQGRQGASSLAPAITGLSGNSTISGTITTSSGGGLYNLSSEAGSLTITSPLTLASNATGDRFLQFMGAAGQGYVTSNITDGAGRLGVNKYGNGSWTLSGPANTYSGVTTVRAGTLTLASSQTSTDSITVDSGALLQVSSGGDKTIKTKTLTLNGTFDLADNLLALTATTPDSLRSLLFSARATGDWTGPGLTSSSAAAQPSHLTAIGYALASELSVTTWGSASVSPTDTLAKYTWYGDANLDGVVNADDFALIDDGFATSAATWSHGDFNYDGQVTLADYLLIDTVFGQTQGLSPSFLSERESQFGEAYVQTLLASVPEPASLSSILYPLSSLLLRRRRRHN